MTPFTMPYEFGTVVLVPFPYTDQTTSKRRPAVIVSSHLYNFGRPDIVVMAITTKFHSSAEYGEVSLLHWQRAGLLKPSAVKPIFATLEQRLILRQLGIVLPQDGDAIRAAIGSILG